MSGARYGLELEERRVVLRTRTGERGAEEVGSHCQTGQMLVTRKNKPSYPGESIRKSSVQKTL